MKKFLIVVFAVIIAVLQLLNTNLFEKTLKNNKIRIDIRGANTTHNIDVTSDDPAFNFKIPKWCKDCVSTELNFDKNTKNINMKIKSSKDDKIVIRLMGPDVRVDDKRVPVFINYRDFIVDGQNIFHKSRTFWHDKPYAHTIQIKSGQTIDFNVIAQRTGLIGFLKQCPISPYLFIVVFCFWLFILSLVAKFIDNQPKNKKSDALLVAIFGVLLFIPMLHISDLEKSETENRVLATKPDFIINDNINEKYGTQFNDWFNDRFNGRNALIRIFSSIKYNTNNIYQNSKALLIKDNNWMFVKRDFIYPKNTPELIDNLKKFDDFCKQHNMKLYILLVPEKEVIYSNILDKYYSVNHHDIDGHHKYISESQKALGDNRMIYPNQEMIKASNEDFVFFKSAHHWTDFGAYVGYQQLAKRIKQDFNKFNIVSLQDYKKSFSEQVRDDWGRGFYEGHTTRLLNLKNKAKDLLNVDYSYYDPKNPDQVTETRGSYTKIFKNKNKNAKHKLFLVGNSQNENLVQFMAPSVKDIYYLRLNHSQQSEENEKKFMKYYKKELLNFKPDIVVICVSANYFYALMNDFYKD